MLAIKKGHIVADTIFEYKGKRLVAPVIVDTGAEGFIAIDTPFAERLGLPLSFSGMVGGVGGVVPAYKSGLDSISLSDIKGCALKNVKDVSVHDLDILRASGTVALLGLDFMGATNMSADFKPDYVMIGCAGGPKVKILIKSLEFGPGGVGGGFGTIALVGLGALILIGVLIFALSD